MIKLVKPNIGL